MHYVSEMLLLPGLITNTLKKIKKNDVHAVLVSPWINRPFWSFSSGIYRIHPNEHDAPPSSVEFSHTYLPSSQSWPWGGLLASYVSNHVHLGENINA